MRAGAGPRGGSGTAAGAGPDVSTRVAHASARRPGAAAGLAARIVRSDVRRSSAPVLAVALAMTGGWMLAVQQDLWSGRWAGWTSFLRGSLVLTAPLVAAFATWHAARDSRRRTGGLLASTPRPPLSRMLAATAAPMLAALVGLAIPAAVAAVLVGRVATYAGGWWWAEALVTVPALAAAVAVGTLVGSWASWFGTPVLVGTAGFVGLIVLDTSSRTLVVQWLSPLRVADHWQVAPGRGAVGQAAWFTGVVLVLLALAVLRPGRERLRGAALLAAGGVLVAGGIAGFAHLPAKADFAVDPGATRLVCDGGTPQVCLTRVDAFLLGDVAARVRPAAARLGSVPGGPRRMVQAPWPAGEDTPSNTDTPRWTTELPLPWDLQATALGRLNDSWGTSVLDIALQDYLGANVCWPSEVSEGDNAATRVPVAALVHSWAAGTAAGYPEQQAPEAMDRWVRMAAAPAPDQRAWVAQALAALHRCGTDARLRALLARWDAR